jgi:DNA-binding transcriptional ArsR family regulator
MPDIIAPPKTLVVDFSLEPALNALNSLHMLNHVDEFSGLDEWLYRAAAALTPEQRHANLLVFDAFDAGVWPRGGTWSTFTAWLDNLDVEDVDGLRDRYLNELSRYAAEVVDGDVPTPEQLLADRGTYLTLIESFHRRKGKEEEYDQDLYEEVYALLNDPPALRELVVTHLHTMWDEVLAPEWERKLPMLEESVSAFEMLDFTGMTCAEIVRRVTARDLVSECEKWRAGADRIVFIPSAHIGPYVSIMDIDETICLIFGARVPEGVAASSPTLSRSELLMRLNALADDTRLSILELLARNESLSSQEVMQALDLSQSAASRHLLQLAATGYLATERREGAKFYQLNRDRIGDTFGALERLLG